MIHVRKAGSGSAIRPELELLLLCGCTELGRTREERVRELLGGELEWELVMSLADWHGMLPLLHFHVQSLGQAAIPAPIAKKLHAFSLKITGRNLYLTAALVELLDVFAAAGIAAIPFKGPPLAALIYGNVARRRISDLDIAVQRRDVSAAMMLLASRGYSAPAQRTGAQQKAHRRFQYARPLVSSDGTVKVDLHWGFAKEYFSAGVDPESLWDETAPVSIQGHTVSTFSPEVLLLVLCVHGAKHGPLPWPRLNWICDVAELLRRPGLDWAQTLELARRSGSQRILRLGLALASDLFDAPLPEELRRQLQTDRVVRNLTAQIRHNLLSEAPQPLSAWARTRFDLATRERLRDKARYCLRRIFRPAPRDWQLVRLPRYLAFLYTPLRILRLSSRYLLRPWKIASLWQRRPGPPR